MSKSTSGKRRRTRQQRQAGAAKPSVSPEDSSPSLDVLLTAVRANPDDVMVRLELGEYYLRNDLEEKILDVLGDLNEDYTFPNKFTRGYYHRLLAFGHAHRRQFVEAERAAHRGVEEYPDSLDFYFVLSYLYLSLKEYDRTVTEAERFISLYKRIKQGQLPPPDFSFTGRHITQLYNILAAACQELGQLSEARQYFEKSIQADSGNHQPYANLAILLRQEDKIDQAREVVERGLSHCRQVHELRLLARSLEKRATVSACMIVKDEEELLPGCLESIRDWIDELIIVDTGSTDRTVEIAKSYGARVFHQPWEGNFSKHRNYSLSKASCEWILYIDADERIYQEDIPLIRKVLNQHDFNIVSINIFNMNSGNDEEVTFLPSVRLWRREIGLKYEGIVHNVPILPEDQPIMRAGIRLKHLGYGLSPEKMKAKMARSKALLEKQIAQNPDNAFALFNLAQLLRGEGVEDHPENAARIKEVAGRALQLTHPDVGPDRHLHIMTHHQLGWIHFVLCEYDQAERYCLDVLKIKPGYLDALLLLGHIYLRKQIFDKAGHYYQKYIEVQASYNETCETDDIILLHPASLRRAHYGLGLVAEYTGEHQKAREHYRRTFDLSPDFMDVCVRLGRMYLSNHDYEEAERCFLKQLELDEKSHQTLLGLADLSFLRKNYDRADQYYRRALEINPTDGIILSRYGNFLGETGQNDRAVEMLEKAAVSADSGEKAQHSLAQVYFQQGRFEEAADMYRKLLETERDNGELLNDLGNCWFKTGNWPEAIETYLQALEAPSVPPVVYRNLGLARVRQGELEKAVIDLEKYIDLDPDQHDICHVIGDIYVNLGNHSRAISFYERFLQSNPHDTLVLFRLSECYLNMGHRDSAIIGYRRVLQLDAGFEPAQKRLAELAIPVGNA
ncbi:MAG: tetratricopeptide repeat protein [bacterium]